MLIRSSCAIAVFTALMGMSLNVWQFFAARALMGVFAGFSSTAMALVASQVPEQRLGYALGLLSTGQLVGSLVGTGDRRRAGRRDRQLPHPVLLHVGDHLRRQCSWSGVACTSTSCGPTARIADAPACAAWR